MLIRRRLAATARLMLAALLFAHAALALSACEFGRPTPAKAIAAAGGMPCCPDSDLMAVANPNLCVAHCTADAQHVDGHGLVVPCLAAATAPTAAVAPVPGSFALRRATAPRSLAAPPLTILFQNFRI